MKVKANKYFVNCVFGADGFIENWSEIESTGIDVMKIGELYYVTKGGIPVHNTAFFTQEELEKCLEVV